MGRAELRRQQKESSQKTRVYTLTEQQIRKIKEDAIKEAINRTFILLLGLPLIVLKDKFGFGKKRLEIFQDNIINQYHCFDDDRMTLEEVKQVIETETGCKVCEDIKNVHKIV